MIGKEAEKLALRKATSQEARKTNKRLDGRDAQITAARDDLSTQITDVNETAVEAGVAAAAAQADATKALGFTIGTHTVLAGTSSSFVHNAGFVPLPVTAWVSFDSGDSWNPIGETSDWSFWVSTFEVFVTNASISNGLVTVIATY